MPSQKLLYIILFIFFFFNLNNHSAFAGCTGFFVMADTTNASVWVEKHDTVYIEKGDSVKLFCLYYTTCGKGLYWFKDSILTDTSHYPFFYNPYTYAESIYVSDIGNYSASLSPTDMSWCCVIQVVVLWKTSTGIEPITKENTDFIIFPNPSQDGYFTIKTSGQLKNNFKFIVYNELGKMVYSGVKTEQINLSHLGNGYYTACFIDDEAILSKQKLLINKN